MRIFPEGDTRIPLKLIFCDANAVELKAWLVAIIVVPSHNLQAIVAPPAVSCTVTAPLANQVPALPCATLGPSKKLALLLSATLPAIAFVNVVRARLYWHGLPALVEVLSQLPAGGKPDTSGVFLLGHRASAGHIAPSAIALPHRGGRGTGAVVHLADGNIAGQIAESRLRARRR